MQFLLVIFGWFALITSSLLIIVPYLLRRADLISGWTLFQLSCAHFLGLASIQTGGALTHLYMTPTPQNYVKFALGGTVFYIVSILTYYYFRWPVRLANSTLRKTGPRTPRVMLALIPVCLLLVLGYLFVPNVQMLGQWLMMLGRGSGMIALAFCLVIWGQRPFNIPFAFVLGTVLVFALVAATSDFGRRDFLSVIMTVPICWYWLRGRYYNPARVIMIGSVFVVIATFGVMGVSIARATRANPDLNVLEAAWQKFRSIPDALAGAENASSTIIGSDAVDASLAAIQLYGTVQKPQPFFVIKYILVHPIPRGWWLDKPVGLGLTLPWDVGYNRAHKSQANIGPGVVGHGYHEGGLFFVAFYAWMFASILRWFDTMLARDPSSPYLLAGFCACSGQLVALTRGDIGLFCVLMIGGWLAAMLMNYLARFFFWTEYVPTAEEAAAHAAAVAAYPPETWDQPALTPSQAWRI